MNTLTLGFLLLVAGWVSSQTLYCPSTSDLEPGWGSNDVTISKQGWTIVGTNGGGAAATKAAFNLLNGWVAYTINLGSVNYFVNANIYAIFPSGISGGFPSGQSSSAAPYCDGQGGSSYPWCPELDFIESNGHCAGGSTIHAVQGSSGGTCDSAGCQSTYNLASSSFTMNITFSSTGIPTYHVNGAAIAALSPSPPSSTGTTLTSYFTGKGAVLYSSMWQGWSPSTSSCTSSSQPWGSLSTSSFSISGLQIFGKVVQGPTPATCSGVPPPPPATTQKPSATTKAPSTTPAPSGCNFNNNLAGKQCRGLSQKTGITSQSACQSACCSTSGCKVYQWFASSSQCWIGSSSTALTTSNCPASSGSFVSFSTAPLTSAEMVSSPIQQNYPYIIVGAVVLVIFVVAIVFTLRTKARRRGQTMSDYVRENVAKSDKPTEHVPLESTPSAAALPQQETPAEHLTAPSKPEWEQRVDGTSGQTYYYNATTGATQWETPDGLIAPTSAES